jgi:hypothetical protein
MGQIRLKFEFVELGKFKFWPGNFSKQLIAK